jgi:hypothetical protein
MLSCVQSNPYTPAAQAVTEAMKKQRYKRYDGVAHEIKLSDPTVFMDGSAKILS